jgi:fatty acid/phospholipid biosynthesis enzyme
MKIVVDARGGDFGPRKTVKAAVRAAGAIGGGKA